MRFWNAFGYIDPTQATAVAQASEAAGYYGIVVPDHSHYPRVLSTPYPYSPDGAPPFPPETPWPDVWCVITAMAVATTSMQFTTAVYVAPARPLIGVAHQVATTAVLSGGRVALGVGVGWMREEYEAFGQSFENRGRRLDEMIPALRALWQRGWVEFDGAYYHVPAMHLTPPPDQPIPIYVGGDSEVARRRAAELGDGWILAGPMPVEAIGERAADMRRRLADRGRESEDFTIIAMAAEPWNVDFHRRLADAGVEDIVCVPWTDFAGPAAAKRDDIARFGDDVIAVVNG